MKNRLPITASVLLALAAVAVSARGADSQVCPADDRLAAMPGLRAFIDPQTGQLRPPTPEEEQAFVAALRTQSIQPIEPLEVVVHDDGMVSMDLKGRFLQSVVMRRAADGSLSMGCVSGPPSAEVPRNLAPAKPAPALEER